MEIRTELAGMIDEVEWKWLIPHAKRNAIVVVIKELDLLDVGVAIANDQVTSVERWIREQLIYKPSPTQLATWNQNSDHQFTALIVQPYVLVQEKHQSPLPQ